MWDVLIPKLDHAPKSTENDVLWHPAAHSLPPSPGLGSVVSLT